MEWKLEWKLEFKVADLVVVLETKAKLSWIRNHAVLSIKAIRSLEFGTMLMEVTGFVSLCFWRQWLGFSSLLVPNDVCFVCIELVVSCWIQKNSSNDVLL